MGEPTRAEFVAVQAMMVLLYHQSAQNLIAGTYGNGRPPDYYDEKIRHCLASPAGWYGSLDFEHRMNLIGWALQSHGRHAQKDYDLCVEAQP